MKVQTNKIEDVIADIEKRTGLRVDWHAAGSMSYDAIIRVRPLEQSSKVIAFIYCWAEPFKFCWSYCGNTTSHDLNELIDVINKAEEKTHDTNYTNSNP